MSELIKEGKELIQKREKLNRITDKSVDGWKVADECTCRMIWHRDRRTNSGYEEPEKLLVEIADKRFNTEALTRNVLEASYPVQISSFFAVRFGLWLDRQFSLCAFIVLGFASDPPIPVVQFVLWIYKLKMIYVRLNVVNYDVNIFSCGSCLFFARCGLLGNCIETSLTPIYTLEFLLFMRAFLRLVVPVTFHSR